MRPRVSLPSCRSYTIAPENATCQVWPPQVLAAAVMQRGPGTALPWGTRWQLGKVGKITFSVF